MDSEAIKMNGYFDRVLVDGCLMAMHFTNGLEIYQGENFIDSIENDATPYNHGVARLRINILGESCDNALDEDKQKYRSNLGLKEVSIVKSGQDKVIRRYTIAYCEILIIKSMDMFPEEVISVGMSEEDMVQLSKSASDMEIYGAALKYSGILSDSNGHTAIVDRVYVNKNFRRCGISTWIHSNLKELIHVYSLRSVDVIMLMPGDFSNEADKFFKMDSEDYLHMLERHYKKCGYAKLYDRVPKANVSKNIMYKLV